MKKTLGERIAELLAKIEEFLTGKGGNMDTQPKWTFMVYMAGDNNLSDAGETDLGEMAAVGSTADVNLVVEFDRIGDEAHTKRYYVRKGQRERGDGSG